MKRPKRVLGFLALSVIFFSIIQAQNSGANKNTEKNSKRELDRLLKEVWVRDDRSTACLEALSSSESISNSTTYEIQNCTVDFLKNARIGTRVSTSVQDEDGATRVGAIFERVQSGKFNVAWRQFSADGTTGGLIWSERIGSFSNDNRDGQKSRAEKECEKRGGRLPSKDEFESLMAGFDFDINTGELSKMGKSEFHRLFPDMKNKEFWSSSPFSADPDDDDFAWVLNGNHGYVDHGRARYDKFSVRCILDDLSLIQD